MSNRIDLFIPHMYMPGHGKLKIFSQARTELIQQVKILLTRIRISIVIEVGAPQNLPTNAARRHADT